MVVQKRAVCANALLLTSCFCLDPLPLAISRISVFDWFIIIPNVWSIFLDTSSIYCSMYLGSL